jgi:hypothetical protein
MNKKFSFFIRGLIVFQLLTAAFHSLSFFISPEPANETEKQLQVLMDTYKKDMGAGISRTFADVFLSLSVCFTLICLLGGLINWYMKKTQISSDLWKGLLLIETIIFGVLFLVVLKFTFLPPMICIGLIFIFSIGSYLSIKAKT